MSKCVETPNFVKSCWSYLIGHLSAVNQTEKNFTILLLFGTFGSLPSYATVFIVLLDLVSIFFLSFFALFFLRLNKWIIFFFIKYWGLLLISSAMHMFKKIRSPTFDLGLRPSIEEIVL